jgi:hypothetical protein
VSGYDPVDLTGSGNAGLDVIDTRRIPPIGNVTFHGLPFRIGASDTTDAPFVLLSPGTEAVVAGSPSTWWSRIRELRRRRWSLMTRSSIL